MDRNFTNIGDILVDIVHLLRKALQQPNPNYDKTNSILKEKCIILGSITLGITS